MLTFDSERMSTYLPERSLAKYSAIPDRRAHLVFSAILVLGLIFLVPFFATIVDRFDLPIPLPLLMGVAAVGGIYALIAVRCQQGDLGLCVALIVTSTFAANVPLTESAGSYPSTLGPSIWLFQFPLVGLFALFLFRREYSLSPPTHVELTFAVFVAWTAISAVAAEPIRQDTALYASLFMLVLLLTFSVSFRGVRAGIVSLREMISVFVVTMAGQTAFSLIQLINQRPFGFTFLGETDRFTVNNVLSVGPIWDIRIGVHLSGFTGGNAPLSTLLVMAIPLVLTYVVRSQRRLSIASFICVLLMGFIVRATAKDGARGALVLSVIAFIGLWVWSHWERFSGWQGVWRLIKQHAFYGVSLLVLILVSLYPSSKSGTPSEAGGQQQNGSGNSAGGSLDGASSTPTGGESISLPLFDLQSFGIRIQQYIGGVAMARDNPLFGIGGGNYPYVAPTYGVPATLPASGNLLPIHNVYIAVLAGTGLPGFLFFSMTLLSVVWLAWRRLIEREDIISIGVFAAVLGYLAVAFWITPFRYTNIVPFWILAGGIVAESEGSTIVGESR